MYLASETIVELKHKEFTLEVTWFIQSFLVTDENMGLCLYMLDLKKVETNRYTKSPKFGWKVI